MVTLGAKKSWSRYQLTKKYRTWIPHIHIECCTISLMHWLQCHCEKRASIENTWEQLVIVTSKELAAGSCIDAVPMTQKLRFWNSIGAREPWRNKMWIYVRWVTGITYMIGAPNTQTHYNDVIMSAGASQVTGLLIVYSTICSGTNQRKHQTSALLAFMRRMVNSPHKGPGTRKKLPFDDVIMPLMHDTCYERSTRHIGFNCDSG